tara:strand:- start:4165 stop:5571 length:1407 start_codon:yes stop_codon:yes gene_type:complete
MTFTLRQHQEDMLSAMQINKKGYITCGTGGGKTYTMITDSRRFLTPGSVIVVVAPQLLLAKQLFTEFDYHLSDVDFVYRQVSSESETFQRDRRNLKFRTKVQPQSPSTVIDDIQDTYRIAQKADQPLILFTTYKSLERVVSANLKIDAVYFDEAHNAADSNCFPSVKYISSNANNCYFFTATPRRSESTTGAGFDNAEVYGQNICNVKFKDLIDSGSIVHPYLHLQVSNASAKNLDEVSTDVDAIMETINYYEVKHYDTGAHKVLVACRGTKNIQDIRNSIMKWANAKGYDVLTVDSVNGGYINNDKICSGSDKGKFITKLDELGQDLTQKMIVLHYDMLGEGIDVKAFTGTIFLRNISSNIKAVQAMGRVIRSSPGKKYGIVTIIQHADDTDDAFTAISDIVHQLLSMGVPVDGILTEVSGRGKEDEVVEDLEEDIRQRINDYDIQWQHTLKIDELMSVDEPMDMFD